MKIIVLVCVIIVFLSGVCIAAEQTRFYKRMGWKQLGRVNAAEKVQVQFALANRNDEKLERILMAVSDPMSAQYGKYWSKQQLEDLIAPREQDIAHVVDYLSDIGAAGIELLGHQDFIRFSVPAAVVEREFAVKLYTFIHPIGKQSRVAADVVPTIPSHLQDIVDVISGLRELPLSLRSKRRWAQMNTRLLANPSSAAPVVTEITASQSNIIISVTPKCANGDSTAKGIAELCEDHPPHLHGFNVALTDSLTQVETFYHIDLVTDKNDAIYASCVTGSITTCTVTIPATEAFKTVGVNVTSQFEGQSVAGAWNNFYGVDIIQSSFITPQMAQNLYNIPQAESAAGTTNAIASFSGEYWSSADLKLFSRLTGTPLANISTHGFNNENNPGDEGQLDISLIVAMARGADSTFYSVTGGYLLEWAAIVLDESSPPLVHSISYSDNEADLHNYGPNWAERVDSEFQKFGVRGLTVAVASGDAGASNVGHGAPGCSQFNPQYPASSAYVLSVGATGLSPTYDPLCGNRAANYGGVAITCDKRYLGEILVSTQSGFVWTSGSGFSGRTSRPSWQKDAVENYLATASTLPPSGSYNGTGRAYPDVSSIGSNWFIVLNQITDISAGTSASTPCTAGILSTVNAFLARHDQPSLGFVNPLLYQAGSVFPSSFHDVLVGDTRGGDVLHPPHIVACPDGFYPGISWDAASGWGGLDYTQLTDYLEHLD